MDTPIKAIYRCPGAGAPEDGPDTVEREVTLADLPNLPTAMPRCKFIGYTDVTTGHSYQFDRAGWRDKFSDWLPMLLLVLVVGGILWSHFSKPRA